jgi:quercetin dioxygenase-like cupin family protein
MRLSVTFNVNGSQCRASAGDVPTVPAGAAHGFAADAPDGVHLSCIHASARIAQTTTDRQPRT